MLCGAEFTRRRYRDGCPRLAICGHRAGGARRLGRVIEDREFVCLYITTINHCSTKAYYVKIFLISLFSQDLLFLSKARAR